MQHSYDVVVIGAGSGGLTAAVGFSKVGKKVLLVEREHMGGECTNTGCVPSKALLHHAKAFHAAKQVVGGAIHGPEGEAFRSEAFSYVRNIIDSILEEETPEVFQKLGIDVVMGEAVFTGKNTLQVDGTSYSFTTGIIATGSSPRQIEVPGLDEGRILTNQNIFQLSEIPERLLVIGGGPIGMELGQAMAMLGSQVTIADIGDRLAKLEDPAISPIIQQKFDELGIRSLTQAYIKKVQGDEAVFEIKTSPTGDVLREERVGFDKVLVAVGRVPNLPEGLPAAGIESTKYGITVNNNSRTTNKRIYALGDVSARLKFTHVADDIARQVVTRVVSKNIFGVNTRKAVPKVTYTSPEIAAVGLSWKQATEEYDERDIVRIEVPYSQNDRAKTDSATDGVLIVVAKRLSGRVLGANLAGPAAGELLAVFTLAIDQKISLWKLRSLIYAYPTYSLIIKKAGDYFFATQVGNLKTDLVRLATRHAPKLLAVALWVTLIWWLHQYQTANELSTTDTAFRLFDLIAVSAWGPLLYILIYAVRPVTFFPATLLTILAGVFFGFVYGTILTIIAATFASAVAYGVGRFFSSGIRLENSIFGSWITALQQNTFTAILTMRLIFLPFDGVSYVAGILKAKFAPFLLATFLGILLGTATFVSIGASLDIDTLRHNGFSGDVINGQFILLSGAIFIASLVVSKVLKRFSSK